MPGSGEDPSDDGDDEPPDPGRTPGKRSPGRDARDDASGRSPSEGDPGGAPGEDDSDDTPERDDDAPGGDDPENVRDHEVPPGASEEQGDDPATHPPRGGSGRGSAEPEPPTPEPSNGGGSAGILGTIKEALQTVATVVLAGMLLFAISGVWPPLVAVESGSMEPHMYKGDLVFIVEEGRFAPDNASEGVVTYRQGRDTGYWSFGNHGNVVVYIPHVSTGNGEYRKKSNTPIIHRARFYVEEDENWVAMANDTYLGAIDSCEDISNCPADYDGFITKGDNNGVYDQVASRSAIVKREWIRGVAKVRIPWLGCVRLQLSGDGCF